jgi:hypothetical protein
LLHTSDKEITYAIRPYTKFTSASDLQVFGLNVSLHSACDFAMVSYTYLLALPTSQTSWTALRLVSCTFGNSGLGVMAGGAAHQQLVVGWR